ncbi:MAG: PAS domain S-box protein, partial [Desulfobacterales bacterium]|nr:PAS domain S-box protein [Desulfobacterales bacterium]
MEVKKLFKDQSGDSALLKNLNKELYLESREHKRMEEAFQEIEDCYRDLLEHTKALLYIHDLQGQFLSVNQGAVEILGYDKDSFLKMNIRDILVPEVKEQFEAYLNEIKGHGVAKGVMLVQTAIGEKRVLEYHNTLRTKGVTSPIVRGIAYDITEHIRAEKAIKRLSQENTIVAEIGRIISSTLNIEEVYERFAEEIHKLISFDAIAVNMVNYKESTISIPYVSEIGVPGCQPGEVLPLVGSATGEVVSKRSGLIFQTEDRNEVKSRFPTLLTAFDKGLRSLMVVPLISKDQVIGALHFRSLKSKNFSDQDMKLAEIIGNQIAGTLAIAQLFTELKQADDEIQRNYDTQTVINSLLRLS